MVKRIFKWIIGVVIGLVSLGLIWTDQLQKRQQQTIFNAPNGTYYRQVDGQMTVVDINQVLKQIDAKNPYQGITFQRLNTNVVQVVSHGQKLPGLYEVLRVNAHQGNNEMLTAAAANVGDYVANNDPNNLTSAINYTIANTFNGKNSLSRNDLYQKLIHNSTYRPAFQPTVAKKAIAQVYRQSSLNNQVKGG